MCYGHLKAAGFSAAGYAAYTAYNYSIQSERNAGLLTLGFVPKLLGTAVLGATALTCFRIAIHEERKGWDALEGIALGALSIVTATIGILSFALGAALDK